MAVKNLKAAPNDRFLRACRREAVDRTPVWFMRQAGRYLPEYRKVREKAGLLEIVRDVDLCVEVTLQPVERLGVDAAILFADILLPLEAMGAPFHFAKGEGPVIEKPVRGPADVTRLKALEEPHGLEYVMEDVRAIRKALAGKVPLIGFAGAPFTLAAYLIEGGSSRDFAVAKKLMFSEPKTWHRLLEKLAITTSGYLKAQVEAGAQALQLFDSWVGCLSPQEYVEYVQPHSKAVLDGVKGLGVPVIHFGVDTTTILGELQDAGGDVIGVDWKLPIDQARKLLGDSVAIQGNLDPTVLLAPADVAIRAAKDVLSRARGLAGHIFNVGHGILPQTDPGVVAEIVRTVHAETEQTRPR